MKIKTKLHVGYGLIFAYILLLTIGILTDLTFFSLVSLLFFLFGVSFILLAKAELVESAKKDAAQTEKHPRQKINNIIAWALLGAAVIVWIIEFFVSNIYLRIAGNSLLIFTLAFSPVYGKKRKNTKKETSPTGSET